MVEREDIPENTIHGDEKREVADAGRDLGIGGPGATEEDTPGCYR